MRYVVLAAILASMAACSLAVAGHLGTDTPPPVVNCP